MSTQNTGFMENQRKLSLNYHQIPILSVCLKLSWNISLTGLKVFISKEIKLYLHELTMHN